jgi:maltooligosyltrehalose trehalohydrolase
MIGADLLRGEICIFSVWAPEKKRMVLHIVYPADQKINMVKDGFGYFSATVDGISNGCRYYFMPEGKKDYPDPASHFQPEGVHGPSQVIDHGSFVWSDDSWKGIPLKDSIIYEIHVGTYSKEGTFEAIIQSLDEFSDLGINVLELMPVAQFPGGRNWGYDGVFPYAVQNTYGGPEGLKRLVDACHSKGIAVLLDVVYNHLGPEGNHFNKFGPYFSGKYHVPWGDAINLDDEWSDGVRDYFSDNPGHWSINYHIDGVRVDAIHSIFDSGAMHFWELTKNKVTQIELRTGRRFYMIAESDLNDPKVIKSTETGGYGFDAQWLDDFHHALYVMLDKEGKNRYGDFVKVEQLVKAYNDGFVHSGEFVPFRKKKYGASSMGIDGSKFVVFNQNHDQIGNRVDGKRLSSLVSFDHLKIASAAIFLSPYIPMIFMGEEYGEDNPFYYFVSHTDKSLVQAVREGRKKEFENYRWLTEPPDPQDILTFENSKIDTNKRNGGKHNILLEWNKTLISLRKTESSLQNTSKNSISAIPNKEYGFLIYRKSENEQDHLLCFFNLDESKITFHIPSFSAKWLKILDSKDNKWNEIKNLTDDQVSPNEINAGQSLNIFGYSIVVYSNKDQTQLFKS